MKTEKRSINANRLEWLDVLKCLAMFIVLCGHVTRDNTPDTLRYYIYSFHMPLFFILSGMGFYLQNKRREYGLWEMFKTKVRTLLWPYLILNLLLIPLWIFNFRIIYQKNESYKELLLAILYSNQKWNSLPSSTTWFITCLFLASMVFFVIFKIAKRDEFKVFITSGFFGLLGYVMSLNQDDHFIYPWHMNTVPMAVMLLMFGYIFLAHIDEIDAFLRKLKWKQIILFVVSIGLGYCCARKNVKISMGVNHYGSFILFIGSVVFFSFACYLLARWIPNLRVFKLIGRNTIIYLALHEQFFRVFEHYNEQSRYMIKTYPYAVALFVFIIIIPIVWAVERYVPIILGKKRKK